MRRDDVFQFFGGALKAATALSVTKSAAYQWDEVVPERIAYRAQERSYGHLKVDPAVYDEIRRARYKPKRRRAA